MKTLETLKTELTEKLNKLPSDYVWNQNIEKFQPLREFLDDNSGDISGFKVIVNTKVDNDEPLWEKDSWGKYVWDLEYFPEPSDTDESDTEYYLLILNNTCCNQRIRHLMYLCEKDEKTVDEIMELGAKEYYDIVSDDLSNCGESPSTVEFIIDYVRDLDEDDEDTITEMYESLDKIN